MKRSLAAATALLLALVPCSCIQQQQQRRTEAEAAKQEKKPLPPMHLGAVHQVYPEQGFALLRIIGPMPEAGTTLITHPADGTSSRIGNLCISSQQASRDGIIAADIRSGLVVKGDRVFRYRNISTGQENGDVIAVDPPAGDEEGTTTTAPIPEPPTTDIPAPAGDEAGTAVETTVLPTHLPAAPGSEPDAPPTPTHAPDYLDSIPDDISAWD